MYPTISILTGTLNPDQKTFRTMLESVRRQTYKRSCIEHIVVDGGSSRDIIRLAEAYGCCVLQYPALKYKEQIRFSKGFSQAKGDLILILESDNILPETNWIKQLVTPIVKEKYVSYSYPAYNAYEKNSSLLTKYCALMGSPDPALYYLEKSDKLPVFKRHYDKGICIKETPGYWIVRFNAQNVPTLGDNGFMVKREVLARALVRGREYIHVDAFYDLVIMGYDTAAVVKNAVIHKMGTSIWNHVKRRLEVKRLFTDEKKPIRTYHIMDWQSGRDKSKLLRFIFYSLTFVEPMLVSMRGFWHTREAAWFLHPVMCLLMVVGYGWSEIIFQLKRRGIISSRL